jgi:phosphatidylserine/phosphatidylglycerophosphate/cardiolipin synthase-like enzyme
VSSRNSFTIMNKLFLIIITFINFTPALAGRGGLQAQTHYQLCFTPGDDCTQDIVNVIDLARQSVYVQAYSFTSAPIAKALADANTRNVKVYVILDKSAVKNNRYSSATFLINHSIPVWVDYKPAIAHNKVMIIDGSEVITGSFNFTKAAQKRNAENLLIISDNQLAIEYLKNWFVRQKASVRAQDYISSH